MNTNFFGLRGLKDTRGVPTLCSEPDKVVELSELDRLVQLVYVPDEKTGLASSDLTVLVSDSVNPQIAEWVRSQILRPIGFAPSSIKDGNQIDDQTLMDLTRSFNESQSDYIERVNSLLISWYQNDKGE